MNFFFLFLIFHKLSSCSDGSIGATDGIYAHAPGTNHMCRENPPVPPVEGNEHEEYHTDYFDTIKSVVHYGRWDQEL